MLQMRNLSELYGKGDFTKCSLLKSYWSKYNFKDMCFTGLSTKKSKEVKYYSLFNKVKTFYFIIQSSISSPEMYILGINLTSGRIFLVDKEKVLSFKSLKESRENQLKEIKRFCRYYYGKDC